ncbi:hypothetical protein AGMMS49991_06840 [Spirochaetia bacterium]|nr:hypothetical protein AGMMS49991_06840 [Spirochaetia bacterium]
MIQVLHLFGFLPNMLEWSGNPCVQGCEYCYAKYWKRENEPIERVVNFILKKQDEKTGLLPFLLRKRSPITISNRTDLMSAPDWRERLYALKKLGFPVYLETKLNKDYKDLAGILDREKDTVYQTITGYNNKYEEHNLLTAEEKIEAAKWLNEQGIHHELAVNPYMPDKCSVDDIKKMIAYVKPYGFVMRDYHKPSSGLAKKYYMAEYDKAAMKAARDEIRQYCRDNNIDHDIDTFGLDFPFYAENNLRIKSNNDSFGGNHFVLEALAIDTQNYLDENHLEGTEIGYSYAVKFFAKQLDFFKDCVIKESEYHLHTGASYKKPEWSTITMADFLRLQWNDGLFRQIFDWYRELDNDGNRVYIRHVNGFDKYHAKEN